MVFQIPFLKYVVLNDFRAASVKPGQVWAYKCTRPFHENDTVEYRTVLEVRDGEVKYHFGGASGIDWDCSARIFIFDSTLTTNKP